MAKSWILVALLLMSGCIFSERSYPYDPRARVVIAPPARPMQGRLTGQQWLAHASPQLAPLLPPHRKTALLTEQLITLDGRPADVVAHFGIKTDRLESIFVNFLGLAYSAQAIMARSPLKPAPPWEGFEEVWVPVREDLELAGRLGWARDAAGRVTDADCIVIVPGIRGDNNILRVRDLALALRRNGFHVLTVEVRGTGMTDRRFPKYEYTWGIFETDELLIVADWLQAQPHVRRTGLIGYSWGANQAILAACAEGRTGDEDIPPRLRKVLCPPPQGPRRYQAGVLAFSPILRFEELMDKLEHEQPAWLHPALAGVQTTVRDRMVEKQYPNPCGSIRELIKYMGIGYDGEVADGLEYVRLLPYKGLPWHDRLGAARMPLLIVHAADDMIVPAQDLADLMATVANPDVAAILLPSGGHIGFGPYAPAWYYNLILNYFDPAVGAAAGRDSNHAAEPEPHALRGISDEDYAETRPAAHIAMVEDESVVRRGWLSREKFLDLIGATNLVPGPNSTGMAVYIGYLRAGLAGLLVAGTCFISPAAIIVGIVAWAYVQFEEFPKVGAVLYGIGGKISHWLAVPLDVRRRELENPGAKEEVHVRKRTHGHRHSAAYLRLLAGQLGAVSALPRQPENDRRDRPGPMGILRRWPHRWSR